MRLVMEIALLAVLLFLGWEVPFREQMPEVITHYIGGAPLPATNPRHAAHPPATATGSSGAWMWDTNHKTPLDRPSYNQTHTFTNHITYRDDTGRTYWIDTRGGRHYEDP